MVEADDIAGEGSGNEKPMEAEADHKKFWCNFCNFESDDIQDYLAHSCRAVMAARGEDIPEPNGNECK
jgi:hypothetical protein